MVREGRKRQSEIQHIYKLLPADQGNIRGGPFDF